MRQTVALFTAFLLIAPAVQAQPLVTDGLSVYYSFDAVDENGVWPDGSGNNLHGLTTFGFEDANEDDADDIRLDTGDSVRGGGSVYFDADGEIKEDYIAICDPLNQPDHNDGCGDTLEDRPAYVPSTGFTFAAWMKVEPTGADHSIFQSRAGGGGYIHTQIQGGQGVRMQLRGDANSDNVTGFNELPDGEEVPFDEWVHIAGTYDKGDDPEGFGEFAVYYNGAEVAGGEANGSVAGTELDVLGDWGQGAFLGLVPDFNRQLVGHMDEFYLFNRSLSEDEIQILFKIPEPGIPGDFDSDMDLDLADINSLTEASASQANPAGFDLNGDGMVNSADVSTWAKDLANTWIGDANVDGEFNSGDFVSVFQAGKFEQDVAANWGEGDWNGDGRFNSSDFVGAFQDGGFEQGPRMATASVPEPSALTLILIGLLAIRRRRTS